MILGGLKSVKHCTQKARLSFLYIWRGVCHHSPMMRRGLTMAFATSGY